MTDLYLHSARENARNRMQQIISDLEASEQLIKGNACVYATGSFGRLEAGPLSDLDLFIIVEVAGGEKQKEKRLLDSVDEIKLKFDIIRVAEKHGMPRFDGGGKYLASHTIDSYIEWLGSNEDDYRNTLTGRMLMLLESRPILGLDLYKAAISKVVGKYFRDYAGHDVNFLPAFLLNDISRMWRTFCVNYEFHRKDGDFHSKIKNLKLKFSRMLTCYSAIIYLLAIYAKNNTVHPDDVKAMVAISPTERLETIAGEGFWGKSEPLLQIREAVGMALDRYSHFLQLAHRPEEEAVSEYRANEDDWRARSYAFGESLSTLIDSLGQTSDAAGRLRRLIVI